MKKIKKEAQAKIQMNALINTETNILTYNLKAIFFTGKLFK